MALVNCCDGAMGWPCAAAEGTEVANKRPWWNWRRPNMKPSLIRRARTAGTRKKKTEVVRRRPHPSISRANGATSSFLFPPIQQPLRSFLTPHPKKKIPIKTFNVNLWTRLSICIFSVKSKKFLAVALATSLSQFRFFWGVGKTFSSDGFLCGQSSSAHRATHSIYTGHSVETGQILMVTLTSTEPQISGVVKMGAFWGTAANHRCRPSETNE